MSPDQSRERSLFFLLSTIARNLDTPQEIKAQFKESIGSLQIRDNGETWLISIRSLNDQPDEISFPKNRFSFYPVKSADRYDTNPAVLNRNSAEEVLMYFYGKFGVRVVGKKNLDKAKYKLTSNIVSLLVIVLPKF